MVHSPWAQPSYKKTKRKAKKKKAAKKKKKKAKKKKVAKKKTKKVRKKKVAKKTKKRAKKKAKKKARRSRGPAVIGPKPGSDYAVWCKLCREWVGDDDGDYCAQHPGEWNVEWRKEKKVAKKKKARKTTRAPAAQPTRHHGGGGVRVHCVRAGGKIRVRPVAGRGYSASKNIQFPRHLRHEGCQYVVDALDDKGSHYRAVGEIRPF